MAAIDESLVFYPLRIALLTVSDSRDQDTDKSGALLAKLLTEAGHELAEKTIVKDDVDSIRVADLAHSEPQRVERIDLRRFESVQKQVHLTQQVGQWLGLNPKQRVLL